MHHFLESLKAGTAGNDYIRETTLPDVDEATLGPKYVKREVVSSAVFG